MTRFKDFGSGTTESVEELEFSLHGETFKCVPNIQGKVLLNLVATASDDDPAKSTAIITSFFDSVLEDESLLRFNALLEDKHRIVSVETLAEITGWLVEQYSQRPEELPERS